MLCLRVEWDMLTVMQIIWMTFVILTANYPTASMLCVIQHPNRKHTRTKFPRLLLWYYVESSRNWAVVSEVDRRFIEIWPVSLMKTLICGLARFQLIDFTAIHLIFLENHTYHDIYIYMCLIPVFV